MASFFGKILVGIYVEIKRSDGKSHPVWFLRLEEDAWFEGGCRVSQFHLSFVAK